jgi:hypothetical protein
VFESPRARKAKPLVEPVSARMRLPLPGHRLCCGSNPREPFSIRVTASREAKPLLLGLSPETVRVDLLTFSAAERKTLALT